ncbi:hypothetical protein SLEP1_g6479 [Rubroshorea leprosula]|uniref:DUF1664 domain-containing protein n=1 Tax=Rubroshorea leprosula TaxID=152421 RepID=A0AAV5I489_9ROSI|nr:hypothetical protein SLEP1_g6479 [Rubroshorea leprosula]
MAGFIIKVTVCVGAGILGSMIAKEGGLSDLVNGAAKMIFKQLKQDSSPSSVKKPVNEALLAQVNSLRQELEILASNRSVTIITAGGTGTRRFGIIIVVGVVGYGYIWWKGWKLPDMMFATRRGLSDACNVIAKELENVYSSISVTRRKLSSDIGRLDNRLGEIANITAATQDEVSKVHDKSNLINNDVHSVRSAVKNLESKINRLELKQDNSIKGIVKVCIAAQSLEHHRSTDPIQALPSNSSRLALEPPSITPSRTESLPAVLPPLDDSNGSPKVQQSPRHAVSALGLKEVGESSTGPEAANAIHVPENKSNGSSGSGLSGVFSGGSAPFLLRTYSATRAVQQMRASRHQS